MLLTYDGIVIGRREIGEHSCFIDILTDELGIIEATANGAKKLNSSLLSTSALFSYARFCLNKSKSRYTVNSATPIYSFHGLSRDLDKLALSSYFAQAVKYCATSEQKQPEDSSQSLVRFLAIALYETMGASESGRSLAAVKSAFELRYSAMLGFAPDLVACQNCGSYERPGGMFFLPDRAALICNDCFNREYDGEHMLLRPDTLFAMRNIVFSPQDRCFKFSIDSEGERQLSYICEDYFLRRVERSFPALEYFKSLFPQNQE